MRQILNMRMRQWLLQSFTEVEDGFYSGAIKLVTSCLKMLQDDKKVNKMSKNIDKYRKISNTNGKIVLIGSNPMILGLFYTKMH